MKRASWPRLFIAVAFAGGLLRPVPAHADLFGGDVAVLTSILSQLIQTYNQIRQQLDNLKRQSQYWQQTLKTFDPTSFNQIVGLYNQSRYTYDGLLSDTQAMGYTLGNLDSNFRKLFPPEQDLKRAKYSDYDQMYASWQTELHSSAQIAMRAQANVEQLREATQATEAITRRSMGADGQVQQLQAIVQMLGVVQAQLTTLTKTISTAERVNSNMAAASANEKLFEREARRRRRETPPATNAKRHRRLPTFH